MTSHHQDTVAFAKKLLQQLMSRAGDAGTRFDTRQRLRNVVERGFVTYEDLDVSARALEVHLYPERAAARLKVTVDEDPTWRQRNDLAPGIPVYMTMESALEEALRLRDRYPVVTGSARPIEISFFRSLAATQPPAFDLESISPEFRDWAKTFRTPPRVIPDWSLFCSSTELRDRVVRALISECARR